MLEKRCSPRTNSGGGTYDSSVLALCRNTCPAKILMGVTKSRT